MIYARPDELKLSVRMPQTTFRPGEVVITDIDVRTPQGDGIASALGLVVFDQAVAERLRTDQDFGDYGFSGAYYFDYSRYGSIAGMGTSIPRTAFRRRAVQPDAQYVPASRYWMNRLVHLIRAASCAWLRPWARRD